jgi:acetyltransferase-like isoleucine patch superfamily enzyme
LIYKVKYLLSKALKKFLNIPTIKECDIHKTSKICSASQVVESSIKKYSYIGNHCTVVCSDIGSFCSIADNCIIGGANHPIEWVSTSPVFHCGRNIMRKNFSTLKFENYKRTSIGNDVWIGSNCLIKSGVVIGDGAVIGMGSVVTKDVEPYSIVAGNPAKHIRKRFDDHVICKLLEIKWWNLDDEMLYKNAQYFNNVVKFLEEVNK